LRSTKRNPRQSQALVYSQGAFPESAVVRALDDISSYQLDTYELDVEFPFPQVFVLTYVILVCTKDRIYEYKNNTLELKLSNITPASTWTVADYGKFIVLTNGAELITKDAGSAEYWRNTSCGIPDCLCLCDVNGQLVVGALGTHIPDGFSK